MQVYSLVLLGTAEENTLGLCLQQLINGLSISLQKDKNAKFVTSGLGYNFESVINGDVFSICRERTGRQLALTYIADRSSRLSEVIGKVRRLFKSIDSPAAAAAAADLGM